MGTRRRLLLAVAGVPLLAVAVLAVEVEVARRGENLSDVDLSWADDGSIPVVWLGDSTAYGVGVTDGSKSVASLVAVARDERVTNLAVSGAILEEVLDEQVPKVAALEPRRVYVSVGANDVTHLTSKGSFRADYERLLTRLPPTAEVVVLGVPDMGAVPRLGQPLRSLAGWRADVLGGEIRKVIADRPEGSRPAYVNIQKRTGPTFRKDPPRYFADDDYHPSAAGYALWTDAVLEVVGRG